MTTARFILNAVSERPFTGGRRISRERAISHSRAYRQLVICNKLKQKRSKEIRGTQVILKKRQVLPMWWQTTAYSRMNAEQEHIFECAGSIFDDMNKPYQIALYELDKFLKECRHSQGQ